MVMEIRTHSIAVLGSQEWPRYDLVAARTVRNSSRDTLGIGASGGTEPVLEADGEAIP